MSIPPLPETPYSEIQHDYLEAGLLSVIRYRKRRIDDLRDIFDGAFTALAGAIGAGLFLPNGPAIAIYHGDPQGEFDLEIGFPSITAPTQDIETAAGVLHASALPAGPAALLSHVGAYDGMPQAWARLVEGAEGTPRGIWIEAYVSDPSTTPADQLRTDLILPLQP